MEVVKGGHLLLLLSLTILLLSIVPRHYGSMEYEVKRGVPRGPNQAQPPLLRSPPKGLKGFEDDGIKPSTEYEFKRLVPSDPNRADPPLFRSPPRVLKDFEVDGIKPSMEYEIKRLIPTGPNPKQPPVISERRKFLKFQVARGRFRKLLGLNPRDSLAQTLNNLL
ncbi:unnamed protein product [Ilex paraguariensis]|uniref:Uncharacterized protein n=1 Tax=Ilex paraguariensis TaxID=185542 RepID=A0ABC8TXG2_9AQUA